MILSFQEIIDIVIMTLVVGFIFKDIFRKPKPVEYDPLEHYARRSHKGGINWDDLWFAALVTAPAIILHEFGHKFVAMALGYQATFHAAYGGLVLGIILKFVGFIFFIPAYVSYPALATPLQNAAIAFAGPGVNLLLWLGTSFVLKNLHKFKINRKYLPAIALTSKINMFLFFFNMIPIPPFDGSKVFFGIIAALF